MKKKRDSGIELLRIFAMFMVIGVHAFLYGDYFDQACEYGGMVKYSAYILKLFFRPAVNIFVMITGYFMVHSSFNLKKSYRRLFSMYGTVYFYSIALGIVFFVMNPLFETDYTDIMVAWKMFFPLTAQSWYFLTDYILLCLFAPFLNIILINITKKEYHLLIILTTVVMSIWLCLSNIMPFSQVMRDYGYEGLVAGKNVFSFIYIYMLGGYIGLYGKARRRPKWGYLFGAAFCVLINYVIWINFDAVLDYSSVAISYANPFVVMNSVLLLLFFKDLHFYNNFVNLLASTTIGIYALHEMEYMRNFIWEQFSFQKVDCSNLGVNLLRIFSIMLFIFFTGALIELLRQLVFALIGRFVKKRRLKGYAFNHREELEKHVS